MKFNSVFLFIGLGIVAGTLISLRRQHIRTEYSVSWLLVGIILTALGEFPRLLDGVAMRLGLGRETTLLVAGGTLVSALVFEISHAVSRLRDDNVMMAQRIAILEFQIDESRAREKSH